MKDRDGEFLFRWRQAARISARSDSKFGVQKKEEGAVQHGGAVKPPRLTIS
jgi:hypothetical protein